jgi:hypothetical protein
VVAVGGDQDSKKIEGVVESKQTAEATPTTLPPPPPPPTTTRRVEERRAGEKKKTDGTRRHTLLRHGTYRSRTRLSVRWLTALIGFGR